MSLRYFKESEFRGQYDEIHPELLKVIDEFRHLWGRPVSVSNSSHAIGRTYGKGYHNKERHGSIMAIDLIPSGMIGGDAYRRAYLLAVEAGAGGVGIYPKWNQGPGIHIDVGPKDRTWSAYPTGKDGAQEYYGIEKAFEERE